MLCCYFVFLGSTAEVHHDRFLWKRSPRLGRNSRSEPFSTSLYLNIMLQIHNKNPVVKYMVKICYGVHKYLREATPLSQFVWYGVVSQQLPGRADCVFMFGCIMDFYGN